MCAAAPEACQDAAGTPGTQSNAYVFRAHKIAAQEMPAATRGAGVEDAQTTFAGHLVSTG